MLTVIERARRYVAKCPVAISGQRGHDAAFHVAAVLVHGFALSDVDALALMHEWNRGCLPPWSEPELVHKIRSAAKAQHAQPRGHLLDDGCASGSRPPAKKGQSLLVPPPSPKPAFCPMVLKRIAGKVSGVRDVVEFIKSRSAVPVEAQNCASFLRWLYPTGSGEKVLVFSRMQSQGQMLWKADRSELVFNEDFPSGPDGVWFLPQPVDGEFHNNPRLDGKPSRRSEESVTAWRYVVLESDEAEPDDWLRCLIQMPLRIVSVCESGGRSIHALARLDAASKADWDTQVRAIKPVLITLGADPGALSAVRLTRLPQAKRGDRVQRLLYLNPAPDGTPILRRDPPGVAYGTGAERFGVPG
jgi:hypothetical protein